MIPLPDSVRLPESADELLQQLKNLYVSIAFFEGFNNTDCPDDDITARVATAKEEYLELYALAKTYEALAGEDIRPLPYGPYAPVVMPIIKRKIPTLSVKDILL